LGAALYVFAGTVFAEGINSLSEAERAASPAKDTLLPAEPLPTGTAACHPWSCRHC